jgi:hypothetical protein
VESIHRVRPATRPSRLDLATKLAPATWPASPLCTSEKRAPRRAGDRSASTRDGRSPSSPGRHVPDGWSIVVYREAGEAVATFRRGIQVDREPGSHRFDQDAGQRSVTEAVRRARTAVRRYCAANGLDRLGTLTYRGVGCHDELRLRADVGAFFRTLRSELGGPPFAYLWTAEWHPGGHGLHAHFAVGRYVDKALIGRAWDRGFVEIRRLNEGLEYASALAKARVAAAYLGKYVAKSFERRSGLHRYEVAQGFQPRRLRFFAETIELALQFCVELHRGAVPHFSMSDDWDGWQGPPTVWMQWAG